LGRCAHASCGKVILICRPKCIPNGSNRCCAIEIPRDRPGEGGPVALADSKQPKPFETRHLQGSDLDGDQQTTASSPLSTGFDTFSCKLPTLLIRAGHAQ
jgi:hypothetical protein